jgi:hypothetical protein
MSGCEWSKNYHAIKSTRCGLSDSTPEVARVARRCHRIALDTRSDSLTLPDLTGLVEPEGGGEGDFGASLEGEFGPAQAGFVVDNDPAGWQGFENTHGDLPRGAVKSSQEIADSIANYEHSFVGHANE